MIAFWGMFGGVNSWAIAHKGNSGNRGTPFGVSLRGFYSIWGIKGTLKPNPKPLNRLNP